MNATFHYVTKSGKSACISTVANQFSTNRTVGFVKNASIFDGQEEGYKFELPGGWHLEPMVTEEGEPILTKDGQQKQRFQW
jgi:hypothetical protein